MFILLYLMILLICIAYNLIRIALEQNFKLNYSLFIVLLVLLVWNLFTEKNVTAVKFDHYSYKLLIVEKPIIGKSQSYTLNYEELNFEINNISNPLRQKIAGSKIIILYKDNKRFYVCSSSGFKKNEILAIENKLITIQNSFAKTGS